MDFKIERGELRPFADGMIDPPPWADLSAESEVAMSNPLIGAWGFSYRKRLWDSADGESSGVRFWPLSSGA